MGTRWGMGPVFAYESLLNARRWQVYAGRSFFVLVLLVGMTIVWIGRNSYGFAPVPSGSTYQEMARIGALFFYAMAGIQVSLVMLAAPAAAAGSICMDRARGTLAHMLVTDLSDVEIVLGKLGARLAPVFGLIACGVPVAALGTLLGGIEFGAIVGLFLVSLALAVLGCTLALCISVWAKKTHEVLMAVYMIEGFWLLSLPIWWSYTVRSTVMAPPDWFQKANPYVLVFAPYTKPGFAGAADYAAFTGVVLALSAALAVLSIVRLRRVVVRESGRPQQAVRRRRLVELERIFPSLAGPTLDGNPVLWREWHRNRPSRLARCLWAVLLLITWALAAWGTYQIITEDTAQRAMGLGLGFKIQLLFGLLLLSATAPTALAEERVRGSLDVLLATPLSTCSIVVAKWWGMYRGVLLLALMPLYTAVLMAGTTPDTPAWALTWRGRPAVVPLAVWERILAATFCPADFLASGAVIVSLGLLLATWVRRLGRAVALSVIAYFLTAIGWIMLIQFLFSPMAYDATVEQIDWNRFLIDCARSLSPLSGPLSPLQMLEQDPFHRREHVWVGIGVVIAIKAAFAGLLLWLTIKTFDRCLGRVPESRSSTPAKKPVDLEELAPGAAP
jgi:ABC-type transport system involved in multi-copper enzyme maturation permease subunit